MIAELSKEHAVRDLCELFAVTRSGYYAWGRGPEGARELANRVVAEQIKRVFRAKRQRYGRSCGGRGRSVITSGSSG